MKDFEQAVAVAMQHQARAFAFAKAGDVSRALSAMEEAIDYYVDVVSKTIPDPDDRQSFLGGVQEAAKEAERLIRATASGIDDAAVAKMARDAFDRTALENGLSQGEAKSLEDTLSRIDENEVRKPTPS